MAGRYHAWEYRESAGTIIFWKKTPPQPADLKPFARDIARIIQTYDSLFGPRGKRSRQVWIVDTPTPVKQLREGSERGAVLSMFQPPPDFAFPYRAPFWTGDDRDQSTTMSEIAYALVRTWLGYGPRPDAGDDPLPMAQLADYGAAVEIGRAHV